MNNQQIIQDVLPEISPYILPCGKSSRKNIYLLLFLGRFFFFSISRVSARFAHFRCALFGPALFALGSCHNIDNYFAVIFSAFETSAVRNPVGSAFAFRKARARNCRMASAHPSLRAVRPHSYNHWKTVSNQKSKVKNPNVM